MDKDISRGLIIEEKQMILYEGVKRCCSDSLVIRKTQMKTKVSYHFTSNLTMASVSKFMEKWECSNPAGNINPHKHLREQIFNI